MHLQVRIGMRKDGGSSQPGGIEKHSKAWEGRFLRKGSVGVPQNSKLSKPHWDSTELQAKLPSPGLLLARPGLLPRMAAVAPAPQDLLPRMTAAAAVALTPR